MHPRFVFLIAIGAAAVLPATTIRALEPGDTGKITSGSIRCQSLEIFLQGIALVGVDDIEAARRLFQRNRCVRFEAGETVYVMQDVVVPTPLVCLRKRGEPDCYWGSVPALKP